MTRSIASLMTLLAILAILIALLFFPEVAPAAVTEALRLCLQILIPSLLPLFVLLGILTELLPPPKQSFRLLGFSGGGVRVMLIGILAGFPHAARMASCMVEQKQLSPEEADRTTALFSIAGPAFLIGGIGGMLHHPTHGLLLWGIQLISALAAAVTLRVLLPPLPPFSPSFSNLLADTPLLRRLPSLLARSLRDSAQALLSVCTSITFFAILRDLLTLPLPRGTIALILSGFLEITACSAQCILTLPPSLLTPILSLLFAWSGCSVHAQIALIASNRFPLRTYLLARFFLCVYALLFGLLFAQIF